MVFPHLSWSSPRQWWYFKFGRPRTVAQLCRRTQRSQSSVRYETLRPEPEGCWFRQESIQSMSCPQMCLGDSSSSFHQVWARLGRNKSWQAATLVWGETTKMQCSALNTVEFSYILDKSIWFWRIQLHCKWTHLPPCLTKPIAVIQRTVRVALVSREGNSVTGWA